MRAFLIALSFFLAPVAHAHEFEADRISIMDATADVLDGDTSTLFIGMTILNGAATTDLIGFETNRGKVGDWVEVSRVFGKERVKVMKRKTIRSQTAYEMHRPKAYLVIKNVDPSVYTADFGYIQIHVLFADGSGIDVAAWIDPVYVQIGN